MARKKHEPEETAFETALNAISLRMSVRGRNEFVRLWRAWSVRPLSGRGKRSASALCARRSTSQANGQHLPNQTASTRSAFDTAP